MCVLERCFFDFIVFAVLKRKLCLDRHRFCLKYDYDFNMTHMTHNITLELYYSLYKVTLYESYVEYEYASLESSNTISISKINPSCFSFTSHIFLKHCHPHTKHQT